MLGSFKKNVGVLCIKPQIMEKREIAWCFWEINICTQLPHFHMWFHEPKLASQTTQMMWNTFMICCVGGSWFIWYWLKIVQKCLKKINEDKLVLNTKGEIVRFRNCFVVSSFLCELGFTSLICFYNKVFLVLLFSLSSQS